MSSPADRKVIARAKAKHYVRFIAMTFQQFENKRVELEALIVLTGFL